MTDDEVIAQYQHIVRRVAYRIARSISRLSEVEDMIGDGTLGLIQAVRRFDPARGIKFETYATTRVNGAILDALRARDWVPRVVRDRARDLATVRRQLDIALGRPASDDEVAAKMGIERTAFDALTAEIAQADLMPLEELVIEPPDPRADVPTVSETRRVNALVAEAVGKLPEREQKIVSLHYFESRTISKISGELRISQSRTSQLHQRALDRLRYHLAPYYMEDLCQYA